jgi:hypothetical protein
LAIFFEQTIDFLVALNQQNNNLASFFLISFFFCFFSGDARDATDSTVFASCIPSTPVSKPVDELCLIGTLLTLQVGRDTPAHSSPSPLYCYFFKYISNIPTGREKLRRRRARVLSISRPSF